MFPKPDEFFKQSFEQWEKQTAEFWEGMLRDPNFLKSGWQAMEAALQNQQQWNKALQQQLAAWRLPTRENHERLLHQINRLQVMIDDLNQRMDDLVARLEG
ncbi:MAG: hypothetical protein L0332_18200 [Chloroflexi bacterium]|nr:hypothetical protein [Chloroflexota bacterium]MCI0575140.1 hypothetical protein [Chloroflexota bacterium]MCI0646289.1 hypothetical protein [Chloroflexota bacterium]MCI0728634.1 hypothetical protein [Chloroflexota bacterium]